MKPSSRNPVARALRTLRPKVRPSAKVYSRKVRTAATAAAFAFVPLVSALADVANNSDYYEGGSIFDVIGLPLSLILVVGLGWLILADK